MNDDGFEGFVEAGVGYVIGGVIGHQFGGGNGKKALTVVGSLIGASVANDHSRRHAREMIGLARREASPRRPDSNSRAASKSRK